MTTRRFFTALCLGIAAGTCCAWYAIAQLQPAAPPREAAAPPGGAQQTRAFPWPVFGWIERRYKIEAVRFKARDETGIDWLGSDEVMVTTTDSLGWTVSNEIGDIDSGDTHHFDPRRSCIVSVRPGIVILGKNSVCTDEGEPAPLGFDVEFWEKDIGIFAGFCVAVPPLPGRHAGPHCADDSRGDDFIGHARLDFSIHELETALPNVGDEFIETVVLSPCQGGGTCGGWDLPDYSFTYRITRLPDVQVDPRVVLEDAMRRSGARTEMDAVIAGLRKLPAPRSRNIERQPANQPAKR